MGRYGPLVELTCHGRTTVPYYQSSLGRSSVTEKSETKTPSRRKALSFLGLAALSLAAAPTLLMTSEDAEAQGTTPTTQTPQTGTERRQERRTARTQRRTERRTARTDRRQQRRGTTPSSSGTPQ
jgi:hypothetical protein